MQKQLSLYCMLAAGLLLAIVLCPRSALADAFSGLAAKQTAPYDGSAAALPPGVNSSEYAFGPSSVTSTPRTPTPTTRPDTWPGQ